MRHRTDDLYSLASLKDPEVVSIFTSITSDVRLAIVAEIVAGPCRVQTLAEKLGMNRSRVSKHLAILRDSGVLRARKSGSESIYRFSRMVSIDRDRE